jgi:hypothetical protein
VFSYPAETEIPYFSKKVVCAKCGARGPSYRCAAKLERTAPCAEPDGKAVAVTMILRVITALLLGTLPASARVQRNVEQICAGTVAKYTTPGWYEIGSVCFLEPGKSSNTILAVCREGDTCIVHAIGTLDRNFHIERVLSVDKLCTADDGTSKTFLCQRPPDGAKPR